MLIVGHISKIATYFSRIRITLKRKSFSRFGVRGWVDIYKKLVQEDEPKQTCTCNEVDVSSEILRNESFVSGWGDAQRWSVTDHSFKFAIVRDIHIKWLIISTWVLTSCHTIPILPYSKIIVFLDWISILLLKWKTSLDLKGIIDKFYLYFKHIILHVFPKPNLTRRVILN